MLHRARIAAVAGLFPILAASCSSSGPDFEDGMPVDKAATIGRDIGRTLKLLAPGLEAPRLPHRRPLISETKIWAVWVPEHVDEEADVLVGAHWVYFRVTDAQWLVAGGAHLDDEPRPPVRDPGTKSVNLEPAKRGFADRKWVVPYRVYDAANGSKEEIRGNGNE